VRKYAAEKGMSDQDALSAGMAEKAGEFVGRGSEIYTKE
jgi:phosphomethylpyrimidine synthase